MFDDYVAELVTSGRTVRIAYGLTLAAMLHEAPLARFAQSPSSESYLGRIERHAQEIQAESTVANYWAQRRLAESDCGAEYLALSLGSAPLPGSADLAVLSDDALPLDRLFWARFRQKADAWGYDTLFGPPSPPKWLSAKRPDF
jgi:hypothetical protein